VDDVVAAVVERSLARRIAVIARKPGTIAVLPWCRNITFCTKVDFPMKIPLRIKGLLI
jgi:hypothetical protein